MNIVVGENSAILRTVCKPVEFFDKDLKRLAENLTDTMIDSKGLGIAAPQVDVDARVFIVTLGHGTKSPKVLAMANPEILFYSLETEIGEEGCLSLPNVFGNVMRSKEIVVQYYDMKGVENKLRLTGLDARVVQHEFDHINGVLFIDKLVDAMIF